MVFAKFTNADNYFSEIVPVSPPVLLKHYGKCIAGTPENMKLKESEAIDCEDYNVQPGEEHITVEPSFAKEINNQFKSTVFFQTNARQFTG